MNLFNEICKKSLVAISLSVSVFSFSPLQPLQAESMNSFDVTRGIGDICLDEMNDSSEMSHSHNLTFPELSVSVREAEDRDSDSALEECKVLLGELIRPKPLSKTIEVIEFQGKIIDVGEVGDKRQSKSICNYVPKNIFEQCVVDEVEWATLGNNVQKTYKVSVQSWWKHNRGIQDTSVSEEQNNKVSYGVGRNGCSMMIDDNFIGCRGS